MIRYRSTASKRTRTIVQLLIVAMTAALIVAITACSGEQPQPTHRPQTGDRSPAQTIEAMVSEIAALQTQAAQPRDTDADDQPRPTENPAKAMAPATTTHETTPSQTDRNQILALIPSNLRYIFVLDVKAARQSGGHFPGHYPAFADSMEEAWERRLNTDEITAQQVDTFIYTGWDKEAILLQGDLSFEDIRYQWQQDEYPKRDYRNYEIWDGEETYAILEDQNLVAGSEDDGIVRDFIRVHDGSRQSLAEDTQSELTHLIARLPESPAFFVSVGDSKCSHRIKGCRAYGAAYTSTDYRKEKVVLTLALLMDSESRAEDALMEYDQADDTMKWFTGGLTSWAGRTSGLYAAESVQISGITRNGRTLLAQASVDIEPGE